MKITVEIDDNLKEEEIVLRCRELNDEMLLMQKRIAEAVGAGGKLAVNKGELEYYLNLQEILFFETMISLAIIGCINDELLGIEAITPVTLIMAFCLIGIALDMIFRHRRCRNMRIEDGSCTYGEIVDNNVDGERVSVKNSFGTTSKYINSNGLKEAKIDNCFGECKVYFNNVVLENDHAYIRVDNSFGSTNIYLPATWRINVSQDTALGHVEFRGHGSMEAGAPDVELKLDCSFGEIMVIFE